MSDHATYPVEEVLACDVLVIGSGMAGTCAAIQAAREGCEVILLEKDDVLGGNSGPNLGVHISGAHSFHPYASETGIIGEIEEEAAYRHCKIRTYSYHYNIARQWESLLHWMLETAGVRVRKRTCAKLPVMDGSRIVAVYAEDVARFKTVRIDVRVAVIEASGDGNVAARAGAVFRRGQEGAAEFGERSAPADPQPYTLGTSVTALVRKAGQPVKFVAPPGTPEYEPGYGVWGRLDDDCLLRHSCWHPEEELCFLWHTETGGQLDTIEDDHDIQDEVVRQNYAVWDHIKNGPHAEAAANWELIWVSPKAGKRESRRFLGDHLLTQTEVESARDFPDAVGYGGYSVDIHDPVGKQVRVIFHSIPPLYGIPYRCLYSQNVDNLFLAGRLVSATRLALGTVRLMKTLGTLGQAVGMAAAICRERGCPPRAVYADHLGELRRRLLRADASIPGAVSDDPADLARSAQVSATSEEVFQATRFAGWEPLDRPRGVVLWDWGESLESVELYLRNASSPSLGVELELRHFVPQRPWKEEVEFRQPGHVTGVLNRMEWGADNTLARFAPTALARGTAPRGESWVTFRFDPPTALTPKDPTTDEERHLLLLPATEGLAWGRDATAYDFALRCWRDGAAQELSVAPDCHLFRLSPRPPYGEAANVVNGVNRRWATAPVHMWLSRLDADLPQSLELDFGAPREIGEVHLRFDTLTRAYQEMPFNCDGEVSPMCVADYNLSARVGGTWERLAEERDNYRRSRVHRFPPRLASKLRLTVRRVHDPRYRARVYEVRVY